MEYNIDLIPRYLIPNIIWTTAVITSTSTFDDVDELLEAEDGNSETMIRNVPPAREAGFFDFSRRSSHGHLAVSQYRVILRLYTVGYLLHLSGSEISQQRLGSDNHRVWTPKGRMMR